MGIRFRGGVSQDKLYTMRQLNQHTADVLREINESGRPALITRHGRFVAAILPLAGRDIEGEMVAAVLGEIEHKGQLLGEHTLSELDDTSDVAREMDVELPPYEDRDV